MHNISFEFRQITLTLFRMLYRWLQWE